MLFTNTGLAISYPLSDNPEEYFDDNDGARTAANDLQIWELTLYNQYQDQGKPPCQTRNPL